MKAPIESTLEKIESGYSLIYRIQNLHNQNEIFLYVACHHLIISLYIQVSAIINCVQIIT